MNKKQKLNIDKNKYEERNMVFSFDEYLSKNLKLSETAPVYCEKFQTGQCWGNCNLIHTKLSSAVVCKHWLRGMCKKNEKCDYLHEYIIKKLPECFFFNVYGVCNNNECMFLHVRPDSAAKICVWYNKGFCKSGPNCKNKHITKSLCWDYFNGFCPKGPDCKLGHPNFDKTHKELKDNEIIVKTKFR
ncbi:CPSF4 [Ecytonucleospora hepatopenaei]|uniref:mRNA 3'-end-processing protein n=1 Tax=Ecytonucleospora hepatopenaei TaxID=646526 RepID=A0A1W0E3V4_9MICR|nr:CPSF4 [Ecytonucleospora hepatopenaei]